MKKILVMVMMLMTTLTFSQDSTISVSPYISAGLSMSNGDDFKTSSYPSVEAGIMVENISIGGVFGRNNLLSTSPETIDNYWWEVKTAVSYPIGLVSIYGLFGVGAYIDREYGMFVEYGLGASKEFNNLGIFVQASSWDGIWYVTPGLLYSF
jgi:hypothetical protein